MQSRGYFPLAPMSPLLLVFTVVLLCIPIPLLIWGPQIVGWILVLVYAYVWFWLRPSGFDITDDALIIRWPLRKRSVPRRHIESARSTTAREFRKHYGWAVRIGAGGLWGGFGYLWTRREMLEMYVSGTNELVVLEMMAGRNILISPENSAQFVLVVNGPAC